MDREELYLFDLNGFVVIPGVLSSDEVRACNVAIDAHATDVVERGRAHSLAGGSDVLAGETGRGELEGMAAWDAPGGDVFRGMMAHPRMVPYLHALQGIGFRMDHLPLLVTMRQGTEGHVLHGGGAGFDPAQYYVFKDGRAHCGLVVAAWQLTDVGADDGGFCVVPGSHKANLTCPAEIRRLERYPELVRPVPCRAGDVVLFTEALTHGTLPWRAAAPRRTVLFRFSPANSAFSTDYSPAWDAASFGDLTDHQRAVLEPPSHRASGRPILPY